MTTPQTNETNETTDLPREATIDEVRHAIHGGHVAEVVMFCDECGTEKRCDYIGVTFENRVEVARQALAISRQWVFIEGKDLCSRCSNNPHAIEAVANALAEEDGLVLIGPKVDAWEQHARAAIEALRKGAWGRMEAEFSLGVEQRLGDRMIDAILGPKESE